MQEPRLAIIDPGAAVERLAAPGAFGALEPVGLLYGRAAEAALAGGTALPFLGGVGALPMAFTGAALLLRQDDSVARAHLPAIDLDAWIASLALGPRQRMEVQRATICSPRLPFAGIVPAAWPALMGVVNVTPDSFSDGGRFLDPAAAIAQGRTLMAAGAAVLDIGGESTRPGAAAPSEDEEAARVLPVIRVLAGEGAVVSVDTRRPSVMRAALDQGARIVNDVSGLGDPEAQAMVLRRQVPSVVMHMQGTPRTMQQAPQYVHAALDVLEWCEGRLAALAPVHATGQIALDPGIGFGKTVAHNATLLAHLALFHATGAPVLLGASRKSFVAHLSQGEPVDRRLPGSLAAALAALQAGVQLVRVHDVAETAQALAVARAILAAS